MWIIADVEFDTDDEAREAERLVREGKLAGVSVDLSVQDAEIDIIEEDEDGFPTDFLETITAAEILGATIVAMPAFADSVIVEQDGKLVAFLAPEGIETSDKRKIADGALTWRDPAPLMFNDSSDGHDGAIFVGNLTNFRRGSDVLIASGWLTSLASFSRPESERPTPITISGQEIYGHLASWDSCHLGFPDNCVAPPRGGYANFHTGVIEADGEEVAVGVITAHGTHADIKLSATAAKEHYDDVGSVLGYVHITDGALGPWMCGVLKPGVDEDLVNEVKANGKVSGDWRPINGERQLVAVHAVNVAGFQLPRIRALVAGGEPSTLIVTNDVTTERAGLEIVLEKVAELERLTAPEKAREILASLDA